MTDCLSLNELFDHVRGGVDRVPAVVREHTAGCSSCRDSLEWIERIIQAIDQAPLEAPSEKAVARVLDLAKEAPVTVREERRWSLARLLGDALDQPALAGVRGGAENARRLLFETDEGHLDLEITPSEIETGKCRVMGQLLHAGQQPTQDLLAILWRSGNVVSRAIGNDVGTFVFEAVKPGDYKLDMWDPSSGQGVRIEHLTISARGS
jgi:hypothetical protein